MTYFNFAIGLSLITLSWVALLQAKQIFALRRKIHTEEQLVADLTRQTAEHLDLKDAAHWAVQRHRLSPLMASVWPRIAHGMPLIPELIDQVEDEAIAPVLSRVLNLVQIAPALGLLATTLSLSVGLLSAGDAASDAASALIAVLPTALLSTAAALMLAIVMRILAGQMLGDWQQLRNRILTLAYPRPPMTSNLNVHQLAAQQ